MSGGFPDGALCGATNVGFVSGSTRGTTVADSYQSYSAWSQLTASSPIDAAAILFCLQSAVTNDVDAAIFNLGVGAAGSEVIVAQNMSLNIRHAIATETYFLPIVIPAGSRIAAQASLGSASASFPPTLTAYCTLLDGDFIQSDYAGVEAIGVNIATATFPGTTSGAANTKGSYSQYTASTSRDYSGLILGAGNLDGTGTFISFDVAIGGSGAEQIIVPDAMFKDGGNFNWTGDFTRFYPINIPAGTRIAVRSQGVNASGSNILTLFGVYK